MRIIHCEQGSPEWFEHRTGRATASEFKSVMAKGEGKTRAAYLRRVAVERLTGKPTETYKNANMDRGHDLERFARAAYEVQTGVLVDTIGMILHDDMLVSCSPDFLCGSDGGGELKCVLPTTQLDTILAGGYPAEHKAQIQGSLWIAEREWWDFGSYCPEMPAHLQLYTHRVYRDDVYIAILKEEVVRFLDDVEAMLSKLSFDAARA